MKLSVARFIAENQLLRPQGTVLVALSGGADSVVMTHLLHSLGYQVSALHCNFHLRGPESERDQHFVQSLCNQLSVPVKIKHFHTEEHSRQHGISIEMAARELRYEWFRQEMEVQQAQAIAVGHHLDDQAETLLLNLLRGTGIRGMAAMHPCQGYVIRPLLQQTRKDIEAYAREHWLSYVTDSTNLQTDVLRNRIRHQVMPLLSQIKPAAPSLLARAAHHIGESLPFYNQGIAHGMTEAGFASDQLSLPLFLEKGAPQVLLYEWLRPCGFNTSQIDDIHRHLDGQPGKIWQSNTHRLLLDRNRLLLSPYPADAGDTPQIRQRTVEQIGNKDARFAYLDADKLTQQLTLRPIRRGDWFIPFGMKGRKLVSDFLSDLKLNRFQKEKQHVMCHGEDIVWVVGRRLDNRYAVTSKTKRIIQLEIINTQSS